MRYIKMTSTLLIALSLFELAVAQQKQMRPGALAIKSRGRAPAGNLQIKSSGVATSDVLTKPTEKGKKARTIPRLDIGQEKEIVSQNFELNIPTSPTLNLKPLKELNSPLVIQLDPVRSTVAQVGGARSFTDESALQKIPLISDFSPIYTPKTVDSKPQLQVIQEMKPNEYKLLQAQIFLEKKKNLELSLALFSEVMEDPTHKYEAMYQYAKTARALQLNSDYRIFMLKLAQDPQAKEFQKLALQSIVQDVTPLETGDMKIISPLVTSNDIDAQGADEFQVKRAKYHLEAGQLGEVEDSLALISSESKFAVEASMIAGLLNYKQGKVDEAIVDFSRMLKLIEKNKKHPLKNIGAMTLARIYFQKSLYKEAFDTFLLVDKNDPLWLQATIEQAWTQILSEDYEGAAGNMFSLHTDFFKNAFAPESYVVRSVGYLNLCQFGDGTQVLGDMKRRFTPIQTKLEKFKSGVTNSSSYYEAVKTWLKDPSQKEVEGIPRSFIVELARHPNFTKLQETINNYEDELTTLNNITLSIIEREKNSLKTQNELNEKIGSQIRKARLAKKPKADIAALEKELLAVKVQHYIAQKARTAIKKIRLATEQRVDIEKQRVKEQAANVLKQRYSELLANLGRVIEQNDILQYEMYSGAGEHIRSQMAGGAINDKERNSLKVAEEKSLNWKFQGEIWEDEVGHYRSSLRNVCPKEERLTQIEE